MITSSTLNALAPAAIIASGLAALIVEANKRNAEHGFKSQIFHYVSNGKIKSVHATRETVSTMEQLHFRTGFVCGQMVFHRQREMTIAYVNEELNQVMLVPCEQFDMLM